MSQRREYEIAFVGLKPGIHVFEYQIGDKFFAAYGEQDFKNCNANIKLSLDKNPGFIQLKFDVDGQLESACDKCGNIIPFSLWDEYNIIVKMVDDPDTMNQQEEDPDVYYISRSESHLYLSDWIYEFINLAIPLQKMCKESETGGPLCNKEVLEQLKKMEAAAGKDTPAAWKGLEQFKNLE